MSALRRVVPTALSAALVSTTLLVLAPTAHAAPPEAIAYTSTSFDSGGPEQCVLTGDETDTDRELPTNGVPVTQTASSVAQVVNGEDDADVVRLSAKVTSTARASVVAGSLTSFDVATSLEARALAALGDAAVCEGDVEVGSAVMMEFDLTSPGWLSVVTTNSRGTSTLVVVAGESGQVAYDVAMSAHGTSSRRVYFPAGRNQLQITHVGMADSRNPSVATAIKASARTSVSFVAAGAATGAATGNGRSHVALGSARNCASDSVSATFPKAKLRKKIASTKFLVNGVVKLTVKGATAAPVVLSGLPDTAAVTVKASVKLKDTRKKKKGKWVTVKGKTLSVARGYVACE